MEDVIRLALELQGTTVGLSLDDIGRIFEVSRRTSERMLHAVRRVFPNIEGRVLDDGRKYWRIRTPGGGSLVSWDASELASLETAAKLVEREGRRDQADALRSLSAKLRALTDPNGASRVETDVEALLEGEGLAMRPGPRPRIKPDVVDLLRRSLLACRRVRLAHRTRADGEQRERTVEPYGFLLGGRHYLVARDDGADEIKLFSLSNVTSVEMLDQPFERPEDFDLSAYARQAFGVFQEPLRDVVWRFTPTAAADAREYEFHPTQHMEDQPDGSLLVRFRASGLREMAWHLFQWGDRVEVLEPQELRVELQRQLRDALGAHA